MLQLQPHDPSSLMTSMLHTRQTPPDSPGPSNLHTNKMLLSSQMHTSPMEATCSRSLDLSGQYSPNVSNNSSSDSSRNTMNFIFTQEQVECVCEVIHQLNLPYIIMLMNTC